MSGSLHINDELEVSRHELVVKASRSGGSGGQHVNKTSSRIEIFWNPGTSAAFDEETRERVLHRLSGRLDARGFVRVVADERRSQLQNRLMAEERLAALIEKAARRPKVRRPTRKPRGAVEARLEAKRRNSRKKKERRGE